MGSKGAFGDVKRCPVIIGGVFVVDCLDCVCIFTRGTCRLIDEQWR
jgi:hypothetical protein